MERNCHLDSWKCEGVLPDPSVIAKKIVKNDNDVYVCKEGNTEIRHRNNVSRHLKVCKVKKVQKRKHSCGIFEKIFLFKSKLERHIVTHSRPNFECQYSKSFEMKKQAIDLKIRVVWFYGEPGHGRGLVDAISSFRCKLQLQNEIVTFDSWFQSAEKIVSFLKEYFVNDDSKEHYLIDDAERA